jgi:hypothetical protein
MVASQTHSPICEYEEASPLLLERANALPRFVKDGFSKSKDARRIVSLSEEIVWIEGTVSVAF